MTRKLLALPLLLLVAACSDKPSEGDVRNLLQRQMEAELAGIAKFATGSPPSVAVKSVAFDKVYPMDNGDYEVSGRITVSYQNMPFQEDGERESPFRLKVRESAGGWVLVK